MSKNWVLVDVEAAGASPVNGVMTEFGAVHYKTRNVFHGVLYASEPSPDNPAVPTVGRRLNSDSDVAAAFVKWLKEHCGNGRPLFISDNVAYDWMWIAGMFDKAGVSNPFGHSGRRIGDFYAGLCGDFGSTQEWKRWRRTRHDHNPVNDAMGNVEAFERIVAMAREIRAKRGNGS